MATNVKFRGFYALDELLMNFIWLEDFLALAATGNFSRAADERHSSQPAFSRRIRALEAWIGFDLVDRSTQPASLTEVGEWFRGVAQALLARVSRLPNDAKHVAEANSETLRLASTHALSFTFLPRWLQPLQASAGLTSVQLMSDVMRQCETWMQQSKVQFVLSHAHPQARSTLDSDAYLSLQVGEDILLPVSSPDAQGKPRHAIARGGAAPVPMLRYSDESGLGRILQSVLDGRLSAYATHAVFTAHLGSVLRAMAIDGHGIAWLPKTLIEDDLTQGTLVIAGEPHWCVALQIKLYRTHELVGHLAERFWQSVVTHHPAGD